MIGGKSQRPPTPEEQAEISAADEVIEQLLQKVDRPSVVDADDEAAARAEAAPRAAPPDTAPGGMCTARVLAVDGRSVKIAWRGASEPLAASIAADMDRELVAQAMKEGGTVLVECWPGDAPVVVGIVQTRIPRDIVLKGQTITIEAERELLLRSGRGAMRIREDGDVEIVGSRIMAASRGLFRMVGRLLRLN